jgi:predicted nucleic acid-binding protein
MRIALDTNVLVYAEGLNDASRRDAARDLVSSLPRDETFLPLQVLGELFRALTHKGCWTAQAARESVLGWRNAFDPIAASEETLLSAMDLACDHQLAIWDAIVVSTAADAGCRLLLSEDMHEGFVWRGLTIANPFAAKRHPLLEAALTG